MSTNPISSSSCTTRRSANDGGSPPHHYGTYGSSHNNIESPSTTTPMPTRSSSADEPPSSSNESRSPSPTTTMPSRRAMTTTSGRALSSIAMDGNESVLRFLLLPRQVGIVLLLEFLNSFRSFGLRFVLYNYITNEFGIGDTQAGVLLGVKGFVDIAFGLVGSILVDIYGVRRVSMVSLSVAMVGRTLIAFGRTKGALYLTLYFFSPCGDALLSIGLYKVALKKLTTPLTRPLGFALSYSIFNLAGAFSLVLIDLFRSSLKDMNIETHFVGLDGVYTPVRQFVVVTWMILLLTWIIAYCFLEDLTVIDTNDPEDDCIIHHQSIEDAQESVAPAKPMVRPGLLRSWFPNQYQSIHFEENETNNNQAAIGGAETVRNFPNYKMYKTQYANARGGTSLRSGVITFFNQVIVILRMRATWRVMVFGLATSSIAMNWTASELILPAFLERRFGESTPIYIIQSINLFGCLILPPLVGAYTSGREDFSVFMPGLWVMAISPIFIAMSPNVIGACAWQVVMTVGEVFWSPRQGSWTASLAPTGSEGLFFAVSSARNVFGPLTDFIMGALNEKYNSNCPECRDQYGHFCQNLSSDENLQCTSVQESCDLFLENNQQSCPGTCLQCPSWEPNDPSTCWYLLLLVSIASPLCVWFFLPFLRGNHSRNDQCYGLFSCNKNRFSGIYGALEDEDVDGCQSYGHVSDYEYKRKISLGDDVELT